MKQISWGRLAFAMINYLVLAAAALTCVLPFVNLLAISLSEGVEASAGNVMFTPIGLNFKAYDLVLRSGSFFRSFLIAVVRVGIGVCINLLLIVLTAYPLSRDRRVFRTRSIFSWYFIIGMLFSPSLIPMYMVVRSFGLLDSILALVLPSALPIFSMLVLLNFFRNLPRELYEAAVIDGAADAGILTKIFLPISKPAIATVTLFSVVNHWNAWFDGLLFMNDPRNYPLQSYLRTVVISPEVLIQLLRSNPELASMLAQVSDRTVQAAQLFLAIIPVLVIYPLLQKYFTTGLVLGSVKE